MSWCRSGFLFFWKRCCCWAFIVVGRCTTFYSLPKASNLISSSLLCLSAGVLTGGRIGGAISIVSTPHLENLSVSVTRRVLRLLWVHTLCRILAVIWFNFSDPYKKKDRINYLRSFFCVDDFTLAYTFCHVFWINFCSLFWRPSRLQGDDERGHLKVWGHNAQVSNTSELVVTTWEECGGLVQRGCPSVRARPNGQPV